MLVAHFKIRWSSFILRSPTSWVSNCATSGSLFPYFFSSWSRSPASISSARSTLRSKPSSSSTITTLPSTRRTVAVPTSFKNLTRSPTLKSRMALFLDDRLKGDCMTLVKRAFVQHLLTPRMPNHACVVEDLHHIADKRPFVVEHVQRFGTA